MSPSSIVTTALLSSLLVAFTPAFAQVSFHITVGPPPPQFEMVPPMSPGHVWAPGYWAWHDNHHIWIRGRSMVQRVGYRWEADVWEQRDNRYYRHPGRWQSEAYHRVGNPGDAKPSKHWKKEAKIHGKPGKGKQRGD